MKREINWPLVAWIIVGIIFWAGVYRCWRYTVAIYASQTQQQADMPTFEDIQKMLVDRGHNIEVDGIVGKETLRAWDIEICNQEASKMFERMEKPK